jgi:hypothetical protein
MGKEYATPQLINERIGICDSTTLILRKMKSKPRKSNDGNIKHAKTLGGGYIFQATSVYAESV